MEIVNVDDDGRLYVSSAIDDWGALARLDIRVVIDLEGDIDPGVPTIPGSVLYVYFPMHDRPELPEMREVRALARMAAELYRGGTRILSHCGMGLNRSVLMAGLILHELGWDGPEAVMRLKERRPGALFNETFHACLMGLGRNSDGAGTGHACRP